jgi:transcriptional regulator with AAA-type ATPase domain
MFQIDEILPADELESEVVLHLRLHLRRAIRERAPSAHQDLAMLFGFPRSAGDSAEWREAVMAPEPLLVGAEVAARLRGESQGVVAMGNDASHLVECRAWLATRKKQDDAFARVLATDLSTLLELSKARDLAVAKGQDDNGNPRHLPILIQGDTGVGKELVAAAIHDIWSRSVGKSGAPFKIMQVAGLPVDLINDELFGHVRGSYTGAKEDRIGRIEDADGGTLLIDEVGDLPPEAQLRLLRFLQTQKMSRTGENRERSVQVRILAATWRNLEQMVAEGQFRRDLFYRLRFGTSLSLRPLVERAGFFDDVVPGILMKRGHKAQPLLTRSAHEALSLHKWPGNLRELVGVLEEALSLAQSGTIRLEHLPSHIQRPYISRPLYERASSFLAEELEHQDLTEEHVRWRVKRVEESLQGVMEKFEPNPELSQISKFLASLGESSTQHQEAMSALRMWIELEKEYRLELTLAEYWKILLGHNPPRVVARVLNDIEGRSRALADEVSQRLTTLSSQAGELLNQHPWVKLVGEIRSLPMLQDVAGEQVTDFIGFVLKMLQSLSPATAEKLREEVRKGNFLQRLHEEFSASTNKEDESTNIEEGDFPGTNGLVKRRKPKDLSRDEWVEMTKRYPSQAQASKASGIDPKIISKYLEHYEIPNPWARAGTD